jgi:predicted nucleic acid-binding Zn ribbon protein
LKKLGWKNRPIDRPASPANSLNDLLGSLLGDLGVEDKIAECRAQLAWEKAVGPSLARYAHPLRVYKGCLEVAVPSAVWRSQLSFMQNDIVARINREVGRDIIRELKLINRQSASARSTTQGES